MTTSSSPSNVPILDVWAENLEEEMDRIRDLIEEYPYVAMDTEFPGLVARTIGTFSDQSDYHYQTLRLNVDLLNLIQLGISLFNEKGEPCPGICTWQFNFRFDLNEDMYAQDSINLLTKSGINFKRHAEHGIDLGEFGELLISSGLVLLKRVNWLSFHSGYDFGYLVKIMTNELLPETEEGFFDLLHVYFPSVWDIKHIMRSTKFLKGGLQDVADDLQVKRIGPQHQAGSDSLLTAATFFKIRSHFFEDHLDDRLKNFVFGLNTGPGQSLALRPPSPLVHSNSSTPYSNVHSANGYVHPQLNPNLYSPPANVSAAVPIMQPGLRIK